MQRPRPPAFAPLAPPLTRAPPASRRACARAALRATPRATLAPRQRKPEAPTAPSAPAPAPAPAPASGEVSEYEDGAYARACIGLLRWALRSRTGNRSARAGYAGLVEECRLLLARSGPGEQQAVVEGLLRAVVYPPVGVALFRRFFAHRPGFNAALTPLCFSWLVGKSERNLPPEGGEGVFIEKCRFLEQAQCKGLCVNMCQQPVQNLFTETLGLPLRMTPNYDDNSCQMTFGVAPLPVADDPAASGDCLTNCKMAQAYRRLHTADKCYIDSL